MSVGHHPVVYSRTLAVKVDLPDNLTNSEVPCEKLTGAFTAFLVPHIVTWATILGIGRCGYTALP